MATKKLTKHEAMFRKHIKEARKALERASKVLDSYDATHAYPIFRNGSLYVLMHLSDKGLEHIEDITYWDKE